MGNKELQVLVVAKIRDHPCCVNNICPVERELYERPLTVAKDLCVYNANHMGR